MKGIFVGISAVRDWRELAAIDEKLRGSGRLWTWSSIRNGQLYVKRIRRFGVKYKVSTVQLYDKRAVRIEDPETGIWAECSIHYSYYKNYNECLELLETRIIEEKLKDEK